MGLFFFSFLLMGLELKADFPLNAPVSAGSGTRQRFVNWMIIEGGLIKSESLSPQKNVRPIHSRRFSHRHSRN